MSETGEKYGMIMGEDKEMDNFKKMLYKSYLNNMIFYGKKPSLTYEEWLKEVESVEVSKERSNQ